MDKIFTVAKVVAPIFVSIFLGMYAKRKNLLTQEGIAGMQQFVMNFGLPCVVFNSLLKADLGAEALTSMGLVLPLMLLGTFWAFRARKKKFPYHNFPQLFAAQETGMLGIPLFMILFGADQAYRMGVLDLAQAPAAFPVIALLSAKATESTSPSAVVKRVLTSPLLVMSALALVLNLSGAGAWMDAVGIGGVITECTGFLGTPVSAMMIFSVGYNFSLDRGSRSTIFRISAIHFVMQAVFCVVIQLLLFLLSSVDMLTRWAIFMYCTLPASYVAPSLGRSQEDYTVASGVCSVLTVVSLLIFCGIAAVVA